MGEANMDRSATESSKCEFLESGHLVGFMTDKLELVVVTKVSGKRHVL